MLIDTTLREGAQLFGAYFSLDTKVEIISGLVALGVDEVELGWVGQEGLAQLVKHIWPTIGKTCLSVWSPCRVDDIYKAAALGVDRINIGVPVSDQHIEKRLRTDRAGLLARLALAITEAKRLNIGYISVGLEDISRADESFALSVAKLAQSMGASRIRLSDSVGILTPLKMNELVRSFREQINVELAVHCHDDFGMATGNAITALQSGADYADCSVLGIGERSGIAATEELAAYLSLKERKKSYQTSSLRALCHFVSQAAAVSVPRTKAIAGKDIFSCESGIHAHALSKSPELFEPYNPDAIGANRIIAVGGKSGKNAVINALDESDISYSKQAIPELVEAVKKLSWKLERPLNEEELTHLAQTN